MISFTEDNTQDNDFRVLRPKESTKSEMKPAHKKHGKGKMIGWSIFGIIIVAIILAAIFLIKEHSVTVTDDGTKYLYEPEVQSTITEQEERTPISALRDSTDMAFTEVISQTVNDITMNIYIVHGAVPSLILGEPALSDESIIFASQAADIRADNGKIVGAFVLKGEPLAWGLSKRGYVSIIDGKVSVGMAENSPLFEEATEKGGYFFRQYPLVYEGQPVENEPKGKSVRKAICDRNGEIMIIMTTTPESFHDFSQALSDFGVDNAVYIVGSEYSYGFYRDADGHLTLFTPTHRSSHEYENYIVWKKENS